MSRVTAIVSGVVVGLSTVHSGCVCGRPPMRYRPMSEDCDVLVATDGDQIDSYSQSPRAPVPVAPVEPAGILMELATVDTSTSDDERYQVTKSNLARVTDLLMVDDTSIPPAYKDGVWVDQDMCPQGMLRLETKIATTTASNVFEADILGFHGEPAHRVVVKHMNDCRARLSEENGFVHPLVADSIFMFALGKTGLVPAPLYLSPPTKLPRRGSLPRRIITDVISDREAKCIAAGTETRFLVQEKAGIDLTEYIGFLGEHSSWDRRAMRSVQLGIKVIQMLKELHSMGIVHGDVHGSNVLFRTPMDAPQQVKGTDTDLVFIDFEFAFYFPDKIGTPEKEPRRPRLSARLLSPWHLAGSRVGRRDDVYRALESMSNGLSNGSLRRWLKNEVRDRINENGVATDRFIAQLKDVNGLFEDAVRGDADTVRRVAVQSELDHIAQEHLARYTHPDDRPEYDEIVEHLETVLKLLS